MSELDRAQIRDLDDLNARLWAWLDRIYHVTVHSALNGVSPIERYQRDLVRIRPLGAFATQLDEIFYHRHTRNVRKDGTVTFNAHVYEVPFELVGQSVVLVVDPHADRVLTVESKEGHALGRVTPLDAQANTYRKRRRPAADTSQSSHTAKTVNTVELALQQQAALLTLKKEKK